MTALLRFMSDRVPHNVRTGSTPKGQPTFGPDRVITCCKKDGGEQTQDQRTGEQFYPAITVWTMDSTVEVGDKLAGYVVRRKTSSTPLRGSPEYTYHAS